MRFQLLILLLILTISNAFALGRKPAVEDFVGIETEHPESTPQGTESLFNFEKDMNQYQDKNEKSQKLTTSSDQSSSTPGHVSLVTVVIFLSLPAIVWFLIMSRLKGKAKLESANNIEVLENYRRQREDAKKSQEQEKKAS